MSTIEETVRTTLQSNGYANYMTYAAPVVQALQTREQDISQKLIDKADEADIGYSPDQVRDLLTEIGLTVPAIPAAAEPEPEPEQPGGDQLGRIEQMLRGMATQVESLTQFARRNGYTG